VSALPSMMAALSSTGVLRRIARRTLAVSPESDRFMSVGTAVVSRTPVRDIVRSSFARQTTRFGLDINFSVTHITFVASNRIARASHITFLVSIMIARLFHVTFVVSVMGAVTSVILRVVSVMAAVMADTTKVMSIILWVVWLMVGVVWLISRIV
jgi:hypothetical protein